MAPLKNKRWVQLEADWEDDLRAIDPDLAVCSYGPSTKYYILKHKGIEHLVYGMSTGVNLTITQSVCYDKKLAHSVLVAHDVPVVDHELFVGSISTKFTRRKPIWNRAKQYFEDHGRKIVVKATRGKSGDSVFKVTSLEKLSEVLVAFENKYLSYIAMPFVEAKSEVRAMIAPRVSGGEVVPEVSFLIEKTPLCVCGDGRRTLRDLLRETIDQDADIDFILEDVVSSGEEVDLERVLAAGETFTHWKHNEGKGARFTRVDHTQEPYKTCADIALRAAAAASLYTGCVDLLLTDREDGAPECRVLEMNTAIMLDFMELPQAVRRPVIRQCLEAKAAVHSRLRAATMDVLADMPPPPASKDRTDRPQDYHEKASLRRETVTSIATSLSPSATVRSMSEDYLLLCNLDAQRRCFCVNFDYGLVQSASGNVTGHKVLTYTELTRKGVPCVEHHLVNEKAETSEDPAYFFDFYDTVERLDIKFPCVLKPDSGSSGQNVTVVTSLGKLEATMLKHPLTRWCVSPYEPFTSEFRVIIFGGRVAVAYSKSRPTVTGDGKRTVAQLMSDLCAADKQRSRYLSAWIEGYASVRDCKLTEHQLWSVPAEGEECVLCWQHNLTLGAKADLGADLPRGARDVAEAAAEALNLPYGAMDIVGTSDGLWKVLEINASPAWDHLLSTENATATKWLACVIKAATSSGVFQTVRS